MDIKDQPINKIIFLINELPYIISNDPPIKGNVVIDIRNYTWGVHDGEFAGRICVRCDWVVEGCLPQHVKKLVLMTEENH
jgi:hypothetical protein